MKKTKMSPFSDSTISLSGIKKFIGVFCFVLATFYASAQTSISPKLPSFYFNNGIGLVAPDSSFSLNFRFRMQSRFLMNTVSPSDFSPASWEARVRRTRLSFTGHLYNPKLTYYLQLSFSRGDMDWSMNDASTINTSVNVVRDAMVFYRPTKHLQIGFGQTKLPGNRQRVISSGAQQFYDRSVANATLTLDRDFGFFTTYTLKTGPVKTLFKGAVTSGEGRNSVSSNTGLAYTGRVEVLPFGDFSDGGDYYEGDIAHETKPKLSVAGVYHFNDMAMRTQGELGRDLYNPLSFQGIIVDALLKYKGWAASYEYLNKTSKTNGISVSTTVAKRALLLGSGYNGQLSYCTKNKWEVAARYSYVQPDQKVIAYYGALEQYGGGVSKYFNKHKVKAQFNIFYNRDKNLFTYKNSFENMFAVFQMEFGI
jgi:phosphate-selective porin OprO/OprP